MTGISTLDRPVDLLVDTDPLTPASDQSADGGRVPEFDATGRHWSQPELDADGEPMRPSENPHAPWQTRGLCTGYADLFTADEHTAKQVMFMRGKCLTCPVLAECTSYADSTAVWGFTAGLTGAERLGPTEARRVRAVGGEAHVEALIGAMDKRILTADNTGELRKAGNGTARRRAEAVVQMKDDGMTVEEIARELGYTKRSINRLLRDAIYRYGLLPVPAEGTPSDVGPAEDWTYAS